MTLSKPPKADEPQGNPYSPSLPAPQIMENFGGVNTSTTRAGVPDQACYWIDGYMPVAPRNLRTLPGVGPELVGPFSGGRTIVFFGFYNIGAVPYALYFLSDGSVQTVNTTGTPITTQILPPSTITTPSITGVGYAQWGQQYLLIVANQINGYWVWDGSVLYEPGSLSPIITLTNPGAGYASAPAVNAVGGTGSGATFIATIANGEVTGVSIINAGTGYLAGQTPSLVFTGGLQSGSNGTVSAIMSHAVGGSSGSIAASWAGGSITVGYYIPTISIVAGGTGYGSLAVSSFGSVSSPAAWINNAPPAITLGETGGAISAATLVGNPSNPNSYLSISSGFANAAQSVLAGASIVTLRSASGAPSIGNLVFDYNNPTAIPFGTSITNVVGSFGYTITLSQDVQAPGVVSGDAITYPQNVFPTISISDSGFYYVSGTSISNVGTGYGPNAAITVTGGGSPFAEAVLKPGIVNGTLAAINIVSGGTYGGSAAPTLTVSDSATSAEATISLMPFAISGTAIETYQGRAWIANGPTIYFGAPGSFTDFSTSNGGGNFTSGDNFLRVSYVRLVNTNGFLYLIADSSMNYISGVTTSGVPPTTTFTNQNADPEIGTPYPASVLCRGRDIVLANSVGVHISRGAQLDKVSEALDGVWDSVPNFGSLTQLSSAKATVFSKRIWMVLAQIVDPVANTTQNKLLVWNGKEWYATVQDFGPLTFIATQEINSVLTAWGTDGNVIKPLFQLPSVGFQKTVQSRYWDAPGGYQFSKASSRFWSVWNYNVAGSLNMQVSIDAVGINGADGTTFTNAATYTIPSPTGAGYFVTPPEAIGQQGVLTGMTIKTNEADLSLVSAMLQNDPRISYRG